MKKKLVILLMAVLAALTLVLVACGVTPGSAEVTISHAGEGQVVLSSGDSIQLTASVTVDGQPIRNQAVEWSSNFTGVTVDENGLATASLTGTNPVVTVTATSVADPQARGTIRIEVRIHPRAVAPITELAPTDSLLWHRGSRSFSTLVTPGVTHADYSGIVWSLTNVQPAGGLTVVTDTTAATPTAIVTAETEGATGTLVARSELFPNLSVTRNITAHSVVVPANWIPVTTPQDFQNIENNMAANFFLTNDINMSLMTPGNVDAGTLMPFGGRDAENRLLPLVSLAATVPFTGVLDGRGHSVENVYVSAAYVWGIAMFRRVGTAASPGVIRNIAFPSMTAFSQGGEGATLIGTLTNGTVENVYISGSRGGWYWNVPAGIPAGMDPETDDPPSASNPPPGWEPPVIGQDGDGNNIYGTYSPPWGGTAWAWNPGARSASLVGVIVSGTIRNVVVDVSLDSIQGGRIAVFADAGTVTNLFIRCDRAPDADPEAEDEDGNPIWTDANPFPARNPFLTFDVIGTRTGSFWTNQLTNSVERNFAALTSNNYHWFATEDTDDQDFSALATDWWYIGEEGLPTLRRADTIGLMPV